MRPNRPTSSPQQSVGGFANSGSRGRQSGRVAGDAHSGTRHTPGAPSPAATSAPTSHRHPGIPPGCAPRLPHGRANVLRISSSPVRMLVGPSRPPLTIVPRLRLSSATEPGDNQRAPPRDRVLVRIATCPSAVSPINPPPNRSYFLSHRSACCIEAFHGANLGPKWVEIRSRLGLPGIQQVAQRTGGSATVGWSLRGGCQP